ncbi:MAG: hypothetical protein ACRDN8_05590 [Thermoleophilaceae bacterium]
MRALPPIRSWWRASPRKILASLGVLLLAVGGALASGANFMATSSDPGNMITAGILSQTNSKSNQAVLTASNMAPGDTATGTLDIANSGDLAAGMLLRETATEDTPSSPAFSAKLRVLVEDLGDPACESSCPVAVTKYSGALGAMPEVSLGNFAPGARHRYRFTVTYPDGGPNGADNACGGASTTVRFAWEATQ